MGTTHEVKDLLLYALKALGYDGLYNENIECACDINDLMPCSDGWDGCSAGYYITCGCGGGCDFHIGAKGEPKPGAGKQE